MGMNRWVLDSHVTNELCNIKIETYSGTLVTSSATTGRVHDVFKTSVDSNYDNDYIR